MEAVEHDRPSRVAKADVCRQVHVAAAAAKDGRQKGAIGV